MSNIAGTGIVAFSLITGSLGYIITKISIKFGSEVLSCNNSMSDANQAVSKFVGIGIISVGSLTGCTIIVLSLLCGYSGFSMMQ